MLNIMLKKTLYNIRHRAIYRDIFTMLYIAQIKPVML